MKAEVILTNVNVKDIKELLLKLTNRYTKFYNIYIKWSIQPLYAVEEGLYRSDYENSVKIETFFQPYGVDINVWKNIIKNYVKEINYYVKQNRVIINFIENNCCVII